MKLFNSGIIIRITALWAFSEAFLGGILHGFKIPFAGLALSLVAAICMSLLAVHDNKRGVILKATLVVIAVKFILSPHTPPMAYVAVMDWPESYFLCSEGFSVPHHFFSHCFA
jgi:hypothetical protein